MEETIQEMPRRFNAMGRSQDRIGWRRFLEGMIFKEITGIQQQYYSLNGSTMSLEKWSSGLITRLLEITHGQWVYWNFIVHEYTIRFRVQLRQPGRKNYYERSSGSKNKGMRACWKKTIFS
jgi:hypothetical protein